MKKCLLLSLFFFLFLISGAAQGTPEEGEEAKIIQSVSSEILTLRQARMNGMFSTSEVAYAPMITGDNRNITLNGFSDGVGFLSFSSDAPATTRKIVFSTDAYILAGAKTGDRYYLIEYELNGSTIIPIYLLRYDPLESTFVRIARLAEDFPIIMDMAYNRAEGKMYALSGSQTNGFTALCTIDLATGTLTKLKDYDIRYYGIAADNQGILFMIGRDGNLVRVQPETYDVKVVGNTGLRPYYIESMEFELGSRVLYWALCDQNGTTSLVTVDVNSAAATVLGTIGRGTNNTEIVALSVDSKLPDDSAPAAVSEFIYTPGSEGDLSLKVSWKNPLLTFSGKTLSAIDRIEIYCNGKLAFTVNAPIPGAYESVDLSGLSTGWNIVKVVAVNSAGNGDFREETKWVGIDLPGAPTDITLARTDASQVLLTWKRPEIGAHEGWFDPATLKYRITRFSQTGDSVVVAKAYSKGTEFVDKTVSSTNRYFYRIQSLGRDYGLTAHSDVALLGPAVKTPFACFFQSDSIAGLWTMYDNNHDGSTWTPNSYGKYISHIGKSVASDDWAITPPLYLEKDSVYYLYFEYRTGLGEFYPKKLEVTLGQSTDYTQHKVVKTLEFASKITEQARITIPISEAGEYYIGIHDISDYTSASLRVTAFYLAAKHTGKVVGVVKDMQGAPLQSVKVEIPKSTIFSYTDALGNYELDYLPSGKYEIGASCLGYENVLIADSIEVKNDSVSECLIRMAPIAAYRFSGTVTDIEGAPVHNAWISIAGYGAMQTVRSDASGYFEFSALYAHKYEWTVEKFKYKLQKDSIGISTDQTLNIVLEPKMLMPSEVAVKAQDVGAIVSWTHPRDVFRHDNGMFESQTGWLGGNENTLHGAVFNRPAVLKSISWVTTSYQGPHNEMNLWIMDITPEGKPMSKVLFNVMGVATKGDEVWNTYELPEPITAPNGYMLAVSYTYGMSSLAMDSGSDPEYPFIPYVNYKSLDYTGGVWTCIDASFLTRNFLIRAEGDEIGENPQQFNYKYRVWRFHEDDAFDQNKWVLLTPNAITQTTIMDNSVAQLPDGNYFYALAAQYPDGKQSDFVYTDNILLQNGSGLTASETDNLRIYPNPVSDRLYLSRECLKIEVFDMQGYSHIRVSQGNEVDVKELPEGNYLVKLYFDNRIVIRKIVVKH